MSNIRRILVVTFSAACLLSAQAPKDPGVRGGQSAGGTITGLTAGEQQLFTFLLGEFTQLHSVTGSLANEAGNGLGPGYNANGCGICHAFPAIGGTSPQVN